ncbi:alpha/beta hydrolase [Nocardia carnea]|uniref:alpha/beta hydrolase n=1 Tax=Nocardia carnea TaxID=37328 RepID=UPI002454FDA5|nr:alpha/beta hydrolase [Nocardia carnea]
MSDPRIDADYNVRNSVAPEVFDRVIADYRVRSDEAVRGLSGHEGITYDEAGGQQLDIWGVGTEPRPVFLAVHGGYWRMLSRHDTAFMARVLDDAGIATVTVDYGLAPATPLEEIVRQVRAAVAWIFHHGRGYGLAPNRIVVGGSSAGGHLTGTTMMPGWQAEFGLPADVVRAAMPISGLFDLRPLVDFTSEWLNLDLGRAAALSPALAPPRPEGVAEPVSVIAVAENDGAGFLEQSRHFHELWSARSSSRLLTVPGRNHYDVFLDLADPDSELTGALLELIAATGSQRGRRP